MTSFDKIDLIETQVLGLPYALRCELDGDQGIALWPEQMGHHIDHLLRLAETLQLEIEEIGTDTWTATLKMEDGSIQATSSTRIEYRFEKDRRTGHSSIQQIFSYRRL